MQQDKPTLATLGQLDGTVGAVVDAAITEALVDCDDWPFLEKARKVTIEVVISSVHDNGRLKGVDVATSVKLVKPPQTAREQHLRTIFGTANQKVEVMQPDSYQGGMFDDERVDN